MNILLIAPQSAEQTQLAQDLRGLGHNVTLCETAAAALEAYQRTFYPLLVLDWELPDFAAGEFCRRLRALPQGEFSMILGLTGQSAPAALQAAIAAGMGDYLLKPVDPAALKLRLAMLERHLHCLAKHQETEEALRLSQSYAGNMIESSLDMIIAVDLERRIVEFNKAAQQTFGYRLEEVLGQPIRMLYADETEAALVSQMTIAQGRCVREIYNRRKHGAIFPCLLAASILRDGQGNPVGFMGISRDITERKRVEAALQQAHAELAQQNEELARASQLKDDFLSVMSHELRTPLTTILCQAELLQEGIYGDLDDRQLPAVESIGQSGRELAVLINDILDFSQITQGKLVLTLAPVAVEMLCQESLRAIRPAAHEKQLRVTSRIDAQVTDIQADKPRLRQVLRNLLGNAVKFTAAGGAIGLEVHGDPAQRRLHFTVWDTGIGIAPADLERIFQPFEQLHSGLTREYEGAGLGLALAQRMVKLHGGEISVESEFGKGSRFTVSLPWQKT